jgi:hypothetical protein
MASALPGATCVGQHSVCIIRAASLNSDCTPVGGVDSGMITTGIITATATPELLDGQTFEQIDGCGDIAWTYETPARIRKYTLTGELTYFDHEAMSLLFGGTIIVGGSTSDFVGDSIGWAAPNYTDAAAGTNYVEFITKVTGQGVGDCSTGGAALPVAVGHIFGKARFTPGDRTFAAEAATLAFTATNEANPNLGSGPWQDYPGVGAMPNSPYFQVSYSQAEYDAISTLAACGFQTLPTGS